MRRIGIFGGTFNPVHNGHIHLMEGIKEALKLDEVWMMPAFAPPHKEAGDLASGEDRMAMLSLACKGKDGFSVLDYEVKKGGKSYTVETARYLSKVFPEDKFYFLMGTDMLLAFDKWYCYEEILQHFTLVASARDVGEFESLQQKAATLPGEVEVVRMAPLPVSSTEVREKLKNKEDVSALLPESVLGYIEEQGLYR